MTAQLRWVLLACTLSACGKPPTHADGTTEGAAVASTTAESSRSASEGAAPSGAASGAVAPSSSALRPSSRFAPAPRGAKDYGLAGLFRDRGSWHVASVRQEGVHHVEVRPFTAATTGEPRWSWSEKTAGTLAPLGVVASDNGGAPWVVFSDAKHSGRFLAQRMDGAKAPIELVDASRAGAYVKAHAHAFAPGGPPRAILALDGELLRPLSQAERNRRALLDRSGRRTEWPEQAPLEVWTSVAVAGTKPVIIAKRFGGDERRSLARVALRPGGAGAMYWQPPASPTASTRRSGVLLLDEAGRETRRVVDPFPGVATNPGPIAFDGQGTLFVVTRAFRSKGPYQVLTLTASGEAAPVRELILPGADVVAQPALVACAGAVWVVAPAALSSPEGTIGLYLARLEPEGALNPVRTGFVQPLSRSAIWRLSRFSDLGAFGCDGERAAVAFLVPRGGDLGMALVQWDAKAGQSTP